MPLPLLLALGLGAACGVEAGALVGAAGEVAGDVLGLLELGDEPPQAVTSAANAAAMIIRTRFVVMNLLRMVGRSAWLEGPLLDCHGPYRRPVHQQSANHH
jgi:hypothetical protein